MLMNQKGALIGGKNNNVFFPISKAPGALIRKNTVIDRLIQVNA